MCIICVESDIPLQREYRKGTLEFIYGGAGVSPLTGIHIRREEINRMAS